MTGDEMQRAIEFLLKNQANFETRFEETNRQWKTGFEASNRQWNTRFEEATRRFELQSEETNRQIAHTNQVVEALAETQTEFTQTVLGFITSQNALNDSFKKLNDSFQKKNDTFQEKLDALARAQQQTEQAILELTRTVNNFINFSSGNGNSPRE